MERTKEPQAEINIAGVIIAVNTVNEDFNVSIKTPYRFLRVFIGYCFAS